MKIKEIRDVLIGKKVSYHDSFNSNGDCFIVRHIENAGTSVRVREMKNKGWGITIPKEIVETLFLQKEYTEKTTIDECNVTRTWKIIS